MNTAAAWAMLARLALCMFLIVVTLVFMLWWGTRSPK